MDANNTTKPYFDCINWDEFKDVCTKLTDQQDSFTALDVLKEMNADTRNLLEIEKGLYHLHNKGLLLAVGPIESEELRISFVALWNK